MRLLILGATGGIGRALVDQAARGGHGVTAFVRSPEKLGTPRNGVAGPPRLLGVTLLRDLSRDQAEMERVMQATPLDWTIVRPTRLTKGAMTGDYRAEDGRLPSRARAISRADVAHFLREAST
jgi:uncharacterized protein YbjT (DUF2867 family)